MITDADGKHLWLFHIGLGNNDSAAQKRCSAHAPASIKSITKRLAPTATTVHTSAGPYGPWVPHKLNFYCNNPAPAMANDGSARVLCNDSPRHWSVHRSTSGFGGPWTQIHTIQVRSYFLVFVPTIREIRDFYREMQRTNRESITLSDHYGRHRAQRCCLGRSVSCVVSDVFSLRLYCKFIVFLCPALDTGKQNNFLAYFLCASPLCVLFWPTPVWQDARGHWHALAHVYTASQVCGSASPTTITPKCNYISGHMYSRDGLRNWTVSDVEPYSYNISYSDSGGNAIVATRERPKLLFDSATKEPTHIYTAVANLPPESCTRCNAKKPTGACIMCKITAPVSEHCSQTEPCIFVPSFCMIPCLAVQFDKFTYTQVRPLRLKSDDHGIKAGTKPNILHILLDDWGWADAGWHRPAGYTDVQTPNMDALVQAGVELDRHC
eukprot:SAG31_NODE_1073_length_10065_cov_2.176701_2_plen_437_part_00